MKAKRGYREQKHLYAIGRWLKRYFEKRTCRKWRYKDMSCITKDVNGVCELFDEDCENNPDGCDALGRCEAVEMHDPEDHCCTYDSDNVCDGCDVDLNVYECDCEGEGTTKDKED